MAQAPLLGPTHSIYFPPVAEESFNGGAHHFCTSAWARLSIDISYLIGLKVPKPKPSEDHPILASCEQIMRLLPRLRAKVNFPQFCRPVDFGLLISLITPNSS